MCVTAPTEGNNLIIVRLCPQRPVIMAPESHVRKETLPPLLHRIAR